MKPSSSTQAGGLGSESEHSSSSKEVWGAIGVSPKVRWTTWQSVFPKSAAWLGTTNLFLSCTKGDPRQPLIRLIGFVLGIIPQLGRNRFESPSLPDSENLTRVRFVVVIDGSVGYEITKELNWILLLLC